MSAGLELPETALMTWIKICGTTNLEDAMSAVEAGADALGFVFYEKSPRRIDPEAAREIIHALPERVERVGVFVDTPRRQEVDIFNLAHLTAFQRYPFSQTPSDDDRVAFGMSCFWRPPKSFICFPMGFLLEDESRIQGLAANFAHMAEQMRTFTLQHPDAPLAHQSILDTVFLDSGTIPQPGGTGQVFDWEKAASLVEAARNHFNVVVAGGLDPDNVAEAINVLHPWGVDVCSGVEARPGKKDPEKIRAFVAAVRAAEKSS